jgi:hypothetical protein
MDPSHHPPCDPLRQVGRYLVPDFQEASFCAVFCPFSVKVLVDVQGAVLDHPESVPNTALLTLLFRQLLAPTEVFALEPRLEQGKLEVYIALGDRPFDGADDRMYPQRFEVEQLGLRAVVTFECGPVDLLAVTDANSRPALLPVDPGYDALMLELPMRWLGLDEKDLRAAVADPIQGPVFLPVASNDWFMWFSIFGQVLMLDWAPIVARDDADVVQDVRVIVHFASEEAFHLCVHSLHDRFLMLRGANNEGQVFHRVRLRLVNRRHVEEEVESVRFWQFQRELEMRELDSRLCMTALDSAYRLEGGAQWLQPVVDFFRGWLNHQVIDASATNRAQCVKIGAEDDLVTSTAAWSRVLKASESWCRAQHDVPEVDKSVVLKLLDRWAAEGIRICQERLTSEEELLLQWVFRRAAKALQRDLKEVQNSAEEEARRAEEELLGELQREAELEEQRSGKNKKKSKKKRDKKDGKKRADDEEDVEVTSKEGVAAQLPTPVEAAPTPAAPRTQKAVTEAQRSGRSRDAKKPSSEYSSEKKEEHKVPDIMEKERLNEVLEAVSKSEQLHRKRAVSGDNTSADATSSLVPQEDLDVQQGKSRTSSQDTTPSGTSAKKGFSHSRETTEAGSDAPTQLFCDAVTDTASESHTSSDAHSVAPTGDVESSSASAAPGPDHDWIDSTSAPLSMPSDMNNGCTLPTMLQLAGAVHKGVLPPMPDGARSHTETMLRLASAVHKGVLPPMPDGARSHTETMLRLASAVHEGELPPMPDGARSLTELQAHLDAAPTVQAADASEGSLSESNLDSWLMHLSDGKRRNWSDESPSDSPVRSDANTGAAADSASDNKIDAENNSSIDVQADLASHISSLFPAATVHIGPPEAQIAAGLTKSEAGPPASPRPNQSSKEEHPSSPEREHLAKQILSQFPSAKVHFGPPPVGETKSDDPCGPHGDSSQHDGRHPLEVLFGTMPNAASEPHMDRSHRRMERCSLPS